MAILTEWAQRIVEANLDPDTAGGVQHADCRDGDGVPTCWVHVMEALLVEIERLRATPTPSAPACAFDPECTMRTPHDHEDERGGTWRGVDSNLPSAPATTGSAPRYTETCRMSHVHALDCGPQLIVDSPPSSAPPGSAPATVRGRVRQHGLIGIVVPDGWPRNELRPARLLMESFPNVSDGDEVRVSVEVVRAAGNRKDS